MRLATFLFALLVVVSSGVSASDSVTVQQPETDANKAVRLTIALELNPLGSDSSAMRQWLIKWLEQTPDYTVTVCDILGPIPGETVPHSPELLGQQMFGNVTYQIQNPGKTDTQSLQLAGVESALRAYSAILVKDPQAHIPYFDDLLAKQRGGLLGEHMAPVIAKNCIDGNGA